MVAPRHHNWGWGGHMYDYGYGCHDVEDWVYNPRCCNDFGDRDFGSTSECRQHYDNIDIKGLIIWEWVMGALFIAGISLTFVLCCCWRRGDILTESIHRILVTSLKTFQLTNYNVLE